MIVDAISCPPNQLVEADICIVGSGPAGLCMAKEFIGTEYTVCLLESGGKKPTRESNELSDGENIGEPCRPLRYARSRALGGTTNIWSGGCEELDAIDFEKRKWVPHSGWPFEKAQLAPFYLRAYAACGLPEYAFDPVWEHSFLANLPFSCDKIDPRVLYVGKQTNFWELHGNDLTRAPNITVYTNATVVEIVPHASNHRAESLRVTNNPGTEFSVKAKIFVLAAGGLENPRLLLTSQRSCPSGLANDHDLVGRFAMTHLGIDSGVLFPMSKQFKPAWNKFASADTHFPKTSLRLSKEVQTSEQVLNLTTTLHATMSEAQTSGVGSLLYLKQENSLTHWSYLPSDYATHVRNVISDLPAVSSFLLKHYVKQRLSPASFEAFRLFTWMESAPNPDSRVLLSDELDRFGSKRVKLDWRISEKDIPSVRRSHEIFAKHLSSINAGRLLVQMDNPAELRPSALRVSAHHIGATRMHDNPRQGVVDANCAVHGVPNLYVTGSSVFPTSGAVRPTLTIVALALRLADRIRSELNRDIACV